MRHIKAGICFFAVLMVSSAQGRIYQVPEEYAIIQDAIDACEDLDTVVIAPGIYYGPGNRGIKFNGKKITVRSTNPNDRQIVSTTIIDCDGKGRGFTFNMGESTDSTISGLTITNGYALLGGAIYCYNNSGPSIKNCILVSNSAVLGGAIASANSKGGPKITNCLITANSALVGGGGIYCNGGSPTITNCVIKENSASDGGAIYSHNSGNPVITGCTISQNTTSGSAAGLYCYKASNDFRGSKIETPQKVDLLVGRGTFFVSFSAFKNMLETEEVLLKEGYKFGRDDDLILSMSNKSFVIPAKKDESFAAMHDGGVGYCHDPEHYKLRNMMTKKLYKINKLSK